jgi:hypothetical protein
MRNDCTRIVAPPEGAVDGAVVCPRIAEAQTAVNKKPIIAARVGIGRVNAIVRPLIS